MKPYTFEKTFSMALTFETENVELATKMNFLFDVSRKDHSSMKRLENGISSEGFHVRRNKTTPKRATNTTTKTKHNTNKNGCATTVMNHDT